MPGRLAVSFGARCVNELAFRVPRGTEPHLVKIPDMTTPTTATAALQSITGWQDLTTDHDIELCRMYDELGFEKLRLERQVAMEPLPEGIETRTYRQPDGRLKDVETYHEAEPDGPVERFERLMDHVRGALHRFTRGWIAADGTDRTPMGRPTMAEVRREMRRGRGRKPVDAAQQRAELARYVELSRQWMAAMKEAGLDGTPDCARCQIDIEDAERKLAG